MERLDREQYSPLIPKELRPVPPEKPKNKPHSESLWVIIIIIQLAIIAVLVWRMVIMKQQADTALPKAIQAAITQTRGSWTQIPTQTLYPTQTPNPTQTKAIVTRVVVWTPVPGGSSCAPIVGMNYLDRSKMMIDLQAYVGRLSDVKSVSYVIPEKLYTNSTSELFHVTYVSSSDGKLYSKRYIVYVREFGWKYAVFSIDGQCWIDPPH